MKHGKEEGMKEIAKQPEPSRASIRRAMSQMEPELFDDLLTLKMCLSEDASDDRESPVAVSGQGPDRGNPQ